MGGERAYVTDSAGSVLPRRGQGCAARGLRSRPQTSAPLGLWLRRKVYAPGGRAYGVVRATLAAAVVLSVLGGCRNQEAPPEDLKPVVVGPVEMHGVSLGPDATPQQVTYVLMQALKETATAGRLRERDRERRKKLMENQLQLAAPQRIYRNLHADAETAGIAARQRDEAVYRIVKLWAPIVARYVDSFPADPAQGTAAMRLRWLDKDKEKGDARVSYDVTDPVDGSQVTLQVYLTQETGPDGGAKYWRVYRLGYVPFGQDDPAATRRATTAPTTHNGA